jgi:hypothetical protein
MRIWRRRSIGFRWRLRRLLKRQSPEEADWLARYPGGSDVLTTHSWRAGSRA